MPFYSQSLTVPPNTPASAPSTVDFSLFPGLITHVWFQFPRGCAGLLHARVLRVENQVWPTNGGGDLASDGFIVDFAEEYDLTDGPFLLTLSAYNLDDTYQHTVTVWIAMQDEAKVKAAEATSSMLQKFLQLVGLK